MEYARRRNRRRRRRGGDEGGAGRAVVALLMVAAIVYLVSASAAGEWIAQKVIAPVIEAFSGGKTTGDGGENTDLSAEQTSPPSGSSEVSLTTEKNSVSAEVTLPAVTCYMLQMGVFSTEQNASTQAELLKTMGGGGYVLQDGDRYRVLAAGYTTQESAEEVRDRLKAEGVDCMVYTLTSAAANFRVTAPEDQLESVKSGFGALAQAQKSLSSTSMMFDASTGDVDEGKESCANIASALKSGMEVLEGYSDSGSEVLAKLLACYAAYEDGLTALAASDAQTLVAFSTQIKYTQLYLTHEYFKLMEAFGSVA
ncbi:MAG TPA: SPOR domain-containing protein [Clostridia bacterium]|nr:SPOR domain-containing protein [Clostridia bacterium]